MNTAPSTQWTKTFPDRQACRTATLNHRWLAQHVQALDAPLLIPAIRRVEDRQLTFDHVTGHHARPEDAVAIAELMGRLHRAVHDDVLHDARLDAPFPAGHELTIPDFTIDHDFLTLAPFGYDLAKLITSLAMTHGPLPSALIAEALAAYNQALPGPPHHIPEVRCSDLMAWAEVHHVLTSHYLGRRGYRYGWHECRPTTSTPPERPH